MALVAAALPWWLPLSLLAWAVQMAVFHGVGLTFEWFDRHPRIRRFRVREVERRSYRQLLPRVLFNQCVILLPCMLACEFLGLAYVGTPHLGAARFVIDLLLMAVGHDIVQYAVHRGLLHNRRFLWLRHRVHHSTDAARSISACFMSPVDFFLEIVLPYLLPLVLIGGAGSDMLFHLAMPGLAAIGGLYEHSGYDFSRAMGRPASAPRSWIRAILARIPPSFISSHAHGEHHRVGNVSFSDGFGSPGICDAMFGTRWDYASRHPAARPRPAAPL
jgi:sterol desaturase/sphingolipid hydroxylase (fatty acid hydroxylase superfamily)